MFKVLKTYYFVVNFGKAFKIIPNYKDVSFLKEMRLNLS